MFCTQPTNPLCVTSIGVWYISHWRRHDGVTIDMHRFRLVRINGQTRVVFQFLPIVGNDSDAGSERLHGPVYRQKGLHLFLNGSKRWSALLRIDDTMSVLLLRLESVYSYAVGGVMTCLLLCLVWRTHQLSMDSSQDLFDVTRSWGCTHMFAAWLIGWKWKIRVWGRLLNIETIALYHDRIWQDETVNDRLIDRLLLPACCWTCL